MQSTQIPAPDFDLAITLNSGQVFHWEKTGKGFVGAIGARVIYAEQRGDVLIATDGEGQLDCLKQSSLQQMVAQYFSLDHLLPEICASFPKDPAMVAAKRFCRGLRIIRQPKWECLATFICSSMKQVAHIAQISKALRRRLGQQRTIIGHAVGTFPTARCLAAATESELRECALGYRAKNLLATARLVSSGEVNLEAWAGLADTNLRDRLLSLPGVGLKIANCVMLFAYERLRAFPIDVWIERVLRDQYFARKRRVTAKQLRDFSQDYFGDHGGYAQQYLFHYARTSRNRRNGANSGLGRNRSGAGRRPASKARPVG